MKLLYSPASLLSTTLMGLISSLMMDITSATYIQQQQPQLQHHLVTSCNPLAFNISLNNTQCFGLSEVTNISSTQECEQACCDDPTCQMWEWCPLEIVCDGWPYSGACFTGTAQLSQCKSQQRNWIGSSLPAVPPPVIMSQNFLPPFVGVSPLDILNLASTSLADSSWTLNIDNDTSTSRVIAVPFGGYNSDQQQQPYINFKSVKASATYTRMITLSPSFSASSTSSISSSGPVMRFLEFGGCNHGCEIYIDTTLVGVHYGPLMPFVIDITNATVSSTISTTNYTLTVVSRPFSFFVGMVPSSFIYDDAWLRPSGGWGSRLPEGISKYIRIATYPQIRVNSVGLGTTVISTPIPTFTANVTLINDGAADMCVQVIPLFGAWNEGASWIYPTISPSSPILVPSSSTSLSGSSSGIGNNRTTVTVTFSTQWLLGPSSYWWPNRPFNESYITQLHWFNVSLVTATGCSRDIYTPHYYHHHQDSTITTDQQQQQTTLSTASQRFGYVEHMENSPPSSYFYLLNGVRINHLSDATPESGMSFYDAYTSPAFSLPTGPLTGAWETWRRYMRVGMTSNRIHQSTPTQMMMDAADEVGFLLKPETPIRGCPGYEPCNFNPLFLQSLQELIRYSKNHPSVFAYSLENESGGGGGTDSIISSLIDTAAAEDPTSRYLTTEGSGAAQMYVGNKSDHHAINNLHYAVPPLSSTVIQGVGECAWCVSNGMEQYSSLALQGRLNNVAYYAGWDWINYWSNFLEGMNASQHAWHQDGCAAQDRTDGVNGWNSPVVDWVVRAFHPYTIVDVELYAKNPLFTGAGWPYTVDSYTYTAATNSGDDNGDGGFGGGQIANQNNTDNSNNNNITREIVLFNDVLNSNDAPWSNATGGCWYLQLNWTAVWDAANGTNVVASGSMIVQEEEAGEGEGEGGSGAVRPGFHGTATITFPVPNPNYQQQQQHGEEEEMEGNRKRMSSASPRNLYIVMSAVRPSDVNTPLYIEDRAYVQVVSP